MWSEEVDLIMHAPCVTNTETRTPHMGILCMPYVSMYYYGEYRMRASTWNDILCNQLPSSFYMFCSYSVDYSKAWSNHAVRIRYIWSIWFISANRCIHIPDCAWQADMNHYRQRVHWHHIKDRTGSRSPSASIIHNFITSTKPSKK